MDTRIATVERWMQEAVVGLGLCPYADRPLRDGRVRLVLVEPTDPEALLACLDAECQRLDATPPALLETTVIVVAGLLADFDDYNAFLDPAEETLRRGGWEGVYQIASFHPDYRFAGTAPDDPGNWSNRAPFPLLHLLREASISAVLDAGADTEAITTRNIARLAGLTPAQRLHLFGPRAASTGAC